VSASPRACAVSASTRACAGRRGLRRLASTLALGASLLVAIPAVGAPAPTCVGVAEGPSGAAPARGRGKARPERGALDTLRRQAERACLLQLVEDALARAPGPAAARTDEARARLRFIAEELAARHPRRYLAEVRPPERTLRGDRAEVRVRGVGDARALAELAERATLDAARAPWPRIAYVGYELARAAGRERVMPDPLVTGPVARWLHDRGFDVRRAATPVLDVGEALDDPTRLARLAIRDGVDVLLVGDVVVTDGGASSALDRSLRVTVEGRLRLVGVRAERVLATVPIQGEATSETLEHGVERVLAGGALEAVGRGLLVPLRTQVLPSVEHPRRRVVLRGVGAREVSSFVTLMKGLAEVHDVDVRDAHEGTLVVELRAPGTVEDLALALVREADRSPRLGRLELVDVTDDALIFDRTPR
jgi:hypothetical protein